MFCVCYTEERGKSSKLFLEQTLRITTKLASHPLIIDDVTAKQLTLIPGPACPQNISPKSHMTTVLLLQGNGTEPPEDPDYKGGLEA